MSSNTAPPEAAVEDLSFMVKVIRKRKKEGSKRCIICCILFDCLDDMRWESRAFESCIYTWVSDHMKYMKVNMDIYVDPTVKGGARI